MIDIRSISGEVLLSVPVLQDAVSHEELMASDYVQLTWNSDKGEVLPAGSYIEHEGERYALLSPYHPAMQNEAGFRYSPQFHSRIIRWQKVMVPVYTYGEDGEAVVSKELDWSFVGAPADAMSMVVRAIGQETGEAWTAVLGDDLPETVTISAQSSSIWSVLAEIAEQCKTEWWVEKGAQRVHLSKCSHGVYVTLEVGRNIKVPSVTVNEKEYFTRFYAFGSTRNITQDNGVVQGSIVNKRLTLDPVKYPGGFKDVKGHFEGGEFVSDLSPEEVLVKSLYFDEIYPSSPLTIAEVRKRMRYRTDDDGNKIKIGGTEEEPIYEQYAVWYFKIPGFEFTEDLIIENLTLSVAFKSGKLRGREFELAYHPEEKKVADGADVDPEFTVMAGEYEIFFEELNGFIIPDDDYITPSDTDEIVLFNINMPDEYKDSARLDLETQLDKYIEEQIKDNNTYEFESNPVAFHKDKTQVHLGQTVRFINKGETLETRVMMVEKHLDYPCEQKIRVGNVRISGSRQQLRDEVRNIGEEVSRLSKAEHNSSIIQRDHTRDLNLTMGRYFAMRDTIAMLQNAVAGYTGGINPVTVETMAMLVGDEALQFRFTESRTDLTPLENCPLVYDAETKILNSVPCALIHMTLGIDSMTAMGARKAEDYKSWDMEEWFSDPLEDPKKAYYVYAKVEKEGDKGTYVFSEEPIKMEAQIEGEEGEESGEYYHFLVGILNAEYAETRELITLHGFTEILPGRVSTDRIVSPDGNTYFDLVRGEIGGVINFKAGSYGELNIGNQNMLRNSGFTGDYLSEPLADEMVMDAAKELYSAPLDHWTKSGTVNVISLDRAVSGKAVRIEGALSKIAQELYYPTIEGEEYVLSFKAVSMSATSVSVIQITCGGVTELVSFEAEEKRHVIKIKAVSSSKDFTVELFNNVPCVIYDLQLERGTIATAWGNSAFDNNSDRMYYQSLKYLQHALKGATTQAGGLILSEVIRLGDTSNQTEFDEKAGANGLHIDDNSPAFWAGGSMEDAIDLINAYKDNPNAELTDEQIAAMAKFAVTHGGRAILNDMILRGYIHALGGKIGDLVIEGNGISVKTSSNGRIVFTSQGLESRQKDGSMVQLGMCGSQAIMVMGKDAVGGQCYVDEDKYKIAAQINAADKGHAIHSLSGLFAGLRPNIRMVYNSDSLDALDHTIIVDNSSAITLTLPSSPRTGQEYKLIHRSDKEVTLACSSQDLILDVNKSFEEVYSLAAYSTLVLTYYDGTWYAETK